MTIVHIRLYVQYLL